MDRTTIDFSILKTLYEECSILNGNITQEDKFYSYSLLLVSDQYAATSTNRNNIINILENKEYEYLFRPEIGGSKEIIQKNKIKTTIQSYFKNIYYAKLNTPIDQTMVRMYNYKFYVKLFFSLLIHYNLSSFM